jgi:hypothetical protein
MRWKRLTISGGSLSRRNADSSPPMRPSNLEASPFGVGWEERGPGRERGAAAGAAAWGRPSERAGPELPTPWPRAATHRVAGRGDDGDCGGGGGGRGPRGSRGTRTPPSTGPAPPPPPPPPPTVHAQPHHRHNQADHLAVLLDVVAVRVKSAVRVKRDQPQRLGARVHLGRGARRAVGGRAAAVSASGHWAACSAFCWRKGPTNQISAAAATPPPHAHTPARC